jgi:hypothetical protein
MTVDHVVFNRNRYTIRCERQNWLFFIFILSVLMNIIWPSIYLSMQWICVRSSLQRWKLKVIIRMNIVIIVHMSTIWKKNGVWAMKHDIWACIHLETKYIWVYVCFRPCLFFVFFFALFSIRQSTNNDEWQQKVLINQETCWTYKSYNKIKFYDLIK